MTADFYRTFKTSGFSLASGARWGFLEAFAVVKVQVNSIGLRVGLFWRCLRQCKFSFPLDMRLRF